MTWSHAFSRAWRRLHAFASNSDWFIAFFTCVVIGQSNYFGFGFRHSNENRSITSNTLLLLIFAGINFRDFQKIAKLKTREKRFREN